MPYPPLHCSRQKFCLRRVHNEIHNVQEPREALPSQVFQVVAKSNQRAKGWEKASTKGTLEAQWAQCPQVEA